MISKRILTSSQVMVHFDPTQEIILSFDAWHMGLVQLLFGTLNRQMDPKTNIGLAPWTLSNAEKKDSQVEKKGLACIFGVKRSYAYHYGHPFSLITDHKVLYTNSVLNEYSSTSFNSHPNVGFVHHSL